MNLTPAMRQYWDIKNENKDSILFFRMGDFYEMFEDDAKIAHKVLGIALTTRNKNAENPILLAGIPFHAKEKYLPILVEAGYKVAITEQTSSPLSKGIVDREVVRVVTPATLSLEGDSYEENDLSNILVSLVSNGSFYGISIVNLSDHSWKCSEFSDFQSCASQLYKISPTEVILEKSLYGNEAINEVLSKKFSLNIYYYESENTPYEVLTKKLGSKNLQGFGIENKPLAQSASALIIQYLDENQKQNLDFIHNLSYESFSGYMGLDESTIRSLDLVYNIATHSKNKGTLFSAINNTQTAMGKRFLKENLLQPLQDIDTIKERQSYVKAFIGDTILLSKVREELKYIVDLDALLARLSLGRSGPRDLIALKKSLISVKNIITLIEKSNNSSLKKIFR